MAKELRSFTTIKLHYSLHATTDEQRCKLIPHGTSISAGLTVLDLYQQTGNSVEIHYTPIAGVNDTDEDMKRLVELVRESNFHIKLLTFRAGASEGMQPSSTERVLAMRAILSECDVSSEIYASPGSDISASCGMFDRNVG